MEDREARSTDADQECRARLNARLRQAFLAGAEEDSRRRLGRGLTAAELERVLRRYPGDVDRREPFKREDVYRILFDALPHDWQVRRAIVP